MNYHVIATLKHGEIQEFAIGETSLPVSNIQMDYNPNLSTCIMIAERFLRESLENFQIRMKQEIIKEYNKQREIAPIVEAIGR